MARTNVSKKYVAKTHENGRADPHLERTNPAAQLERAVATCLLFENTFYEKGSDIADRIKSLCDRVKVEQISALAIKARSVYKLRHVPLFLLIQLIRLARGSSLVQHTIAEVIQRPDEMSELLSLYWKQNGKDKPLSGQLKKGLARAFDKFNAYQLAKWNRDGEIKLRDVAFLVHPNPSDVHAPTWAKLVNRTFYPESIKAAHESLEEFSTLESPDTWEVALSSGKDKRATWERLLMENKLGYIALLANLRNMEQVKVHSSLIRKALLTGAQNSKALPFRFVAAARHAPSMAQDISDAMILALSGAEKLAGDTCLVIDVSGSMDRQLSDKSEISRLDAAGALAVLLREICESVRIFTFSDGLVEVHNYRGLPMLQGINNSQKHSGTNLAGSLEALKKYHSTADRVIVITDEQSSDGSIRNWTRNGYICNVAPYKPGLELTGGWVRINGWSERIVDFIRYEESPKTDE